jgi:hydroxymethylbilane synthase
MGILKIATRKSELAQYQTDLIGSMLKNKYDIEYEKVLIETKGDKILDVTLDKIGGKGLFVKDIEFAMLEGKAEAAVHSLKDVPHKIPEEFKIAAVPAREDVRDVFVSENGVSFFDLPDGARIGTSSIRRSKQLKLLRPNIEILPVRGNVRTRLNKLKTEGLDGIVLAAAGLKRLGMENIITDYFSPYEFVPAIGQGAIAVEVLKGSSFIELIQGINDEDTRICVEAERSFMRRLNGDCHSAIGAYARLDGDTMHMIGLYEVEGQLAQEVNSGKKEEYLKIGLELAEAILK